MSIHHEVESALIGAAILDPSIVDRMAFAVDESDFIDQDLGRIWSHMIDLSASGENFGDIAILRSRLNAAGLLEAIGGTAGIVRISERGVPSSAGQYAREIREGSRRRKLAAMADEILNRCNDPSSTPDEITEWIESQLTVVQSGGVTESQTLADAARDAIREMWEAKAAGKKRGLKTGIRTVDEQIGGLHAGEMIVLAARPSIGKSALAAQIATNVAVDGKPVLFVSLEMTGADMAYRFLAAEAGVEIRELRAANVTRSELERCDDAVSKIDDVPFHLWSSRSATVDRIRAAAKVQRSRGGLSLLVVDYLGLVRPGDSRKPRWEQITEASGAFKTLAVELGIPVLVLCQLNREAEKEKNGPGPHHLRDAGAIEQDADIVGLLHRDSRSSRIATLNLAKVRNGPTAFVDLSFDPSSCRFDSPTSEDHPNYHSEFDEYKSEEAF